MRSLELGPPSDHFGGIVALYEAVLSTDNAVVALTHAEVFSSGLCLHVRVLGRRNGMTRDAWQVFTRSTARPLRPSDKDYRQIDEPGQLRLSIRCGEFGQLEAVDVVQGVDRSPPLFVDLRGNATFGPREFVATKRLWLTPVPSDDELVLEVSWPLATSRPVSVGIAGERLRSATALSRSLWPE